MTIENRSKFPPMSERLPNGNYLATLDNYTGPSEFIKGLQRIRENTEDIPKLSYISPVILLTDLYNLYLQHGEGPIVQSLRSTWEGLEGGRHDITVRRGFPNSEGQRQPGRSRKRSGNIITFEEFISEVKDFYEDYQTLYQNTDVLPELIVHQLINGNNPPKESNLPHAGGDVTCIEEGLYEIRTTYGADESVMGSARDLWKVRINPQDESDVRIDLVQRGIKTDSMVIGPDNNYKTIEIPQEYQTSSPINGFQAHILALACHRVSTKYGPQRIEWNQTAQYGEELFFITEVEPFKLPEVPIEVLRRFETPVIRPIITPVDEDPEDLEKIIQPEDIAFVHLPQESLRRDTRGNILTHLAYIARNKNTKLLAFASTEEGSEHALSVLWEKGHPIIYLGQKTTVSPGEEIRVFSHEGKVVWERENLVVTKENASGNSADEIGEKAAGLVWLTENRFLTPDFLIVRAPFLRRIIEDIGLTDQLDDLLKKGKHNELVNRLTMGIRRYQGPLLHGVLTQIEQGIVNFKTPKVLVRSSANIEGQKGGESFSGHFATQETSREINRIKNGISSVLISTFSAKPIEGMRYALIKPSEVKMAVPVQEKIPGDRWKCYTDSAPLEKRGYIGLVSSEDGRTIYIDKKTGEIKEGAESLTDRERALMPKLMTDVFRMIKIYSGDLEIELIIPHKPTQPDEIFYVQRKPLEQVF